MFNLSNIIYLVIAVVLSMSIHETAHGLVSYWMGDPTAKIEGRLSLNPFKHVDWIGLVCLLVCGFGWAKPVPVDARYYKDAKTGIIWTSFAGPIANFLLSFICVFLFYALYKFAEACGNYRQFTLTRLLDTSVESAGISPTQIFGLNRETMEKILNGLTFNYPDLIEARFTLGLDNITLKSDKTANEILNELF